MLKLFCDGGVCLKNPSSIGGTWAWVIVDGDEPVEQKSGFIKPEEMKSGTVTNNQTELLAIVRGFQRLHPANVVHVCSDSMVSLGRVFRKYPFNNIPTWLREELEAEKKRLLKFFEFRYVLMDGHPTRKHLEQGFGKRGNPTSKWNKLCDDLCTKESAAYLKAHPHILSTFSESEKLKISL